MNADQAAKALAAIDQETGSAFRLAAKPLVGALKEADAAHWHQQLVAIAGAGWRSHEAALLLVQAAPEITAKASPARLLEITAMGGRLAGYSHEPACLYFEGAARLVGQGLDASLQQIEAGLAPIHAKYQRASGIVGAFLKAGFALAEAEQDDLACYLAIAAAALPLPRDTLHSFLKQAAGERLPLQVAAKMSGQSPRAALAYLQASQGIAAKVPGQARPALEALLVRFAGTQLQPLLEAIAECQVRTSADWQTLAGLGQLLDDPRWFACLLEQAAALPLAQPRLVHGWLEAGLAHWGDKRRGDSHKAALAYIRRESLVSQQLLAEMRGQVSFEDWRPVFQLLAESSGIKRLKLEATASGQASYRGSPQLKAGAQGLAIQLPDSVALFPSKEANFSFYKVCLFHQLGYFEFGCFDGIAQVTASLAGLGNRPLAERLFAILEDSRIDWQLAHRFRGLAPQLAQHKALAARALPAKPGSRQFRLLCYLVSASLDAADPAWLAPDATDFASLVDEQLAKLRLPDASLEDSLAALMHLYPVVWDGAAEGQADVDEALMPEEAPPPVAFRGDLAAEQMEAAKRIDALLESLEEATTSEAEATAISSQLAPEALAPDEISPGEVSEGVGLIIEALRRELAGLAEQTEAGAAKPGAPLAARLGGARNQAATYLYDEWDDEIADYRPRWVKLHEIRTLEEDADYVAATLDKHEALARRVRGQLANLKPELPSKVKGMTEGEELDIEGCISYLVDRKAGLSPAEKIYVQRRRRERDVSTLFLLDMSASTDDIMPDSGEPPAPPGDDDSDEALVRYFEARREYEAGARRIIDLEKESVILMAEALEKLGDSYSVCGFSGYGREQVEYYLCKDFKEAYNHQTKGRIGGIKPCRSTRMGAPIRHATKSLVRTGSRVKALIIISDGYPQDHDYGSDRNTKDYGLKDTQRALCEARRQGVLSYCLTVDPSGQDYLRAMCPGSQYMVIQDLAQLPEEISRVYRSLTN